MRILHYGVSDNYGGIEQYVFKLYNQALKNNIVFDFIATSKNIAYKKYYEKNKSKILLVSSRKEGLFKNKIQVKKIFKDYKYDIVHIHLNTLSYIYPILCAIKSGSRVIVHSRSSGTNKSFITRFLHFINKKRLEHLDITRVAVSKKAGEWLFGKNSNYNLINNGVEIEKYGFNNKDRSELRKKYGFNNDFVIGNVGAFTYAKNHKFIIDIFIKILEMIPESKLVLVGDGILKTEIAEYVKYKNINNNCVFTGVRNDVEKYYSMFDYFLFPSYYEGYPNVVLESQASGLKSVISDNITDEVIVTHLCKKISLNNDSQVWADYIIKDYSNKEHNRIEYKKKLRNADVDSTRHLNKILDLYKILEEKNVNYKKNKKHIK